MRKLLGTKRAWTRPALQERAHRNAGVSRQRITLILLLYSIFFVGCAGVTPEPAVNETKPEEQSDTITVKDHASIDSRARSDFRAALTFLDDGQYEKGIQLLESVIERAPEAIAPQVNLAIAHVRLEQLELAEERFQRALEINPSHPVTNNEYALLLRKVGRFPEARNFYRKALQAYPDFQPARKNLGILCDLYMNDPECALEHYQAYAEAVPGDEDVELWIVDLKRRVGD
ncbi:tetratricopeptide repeat protein [Thiohalomonas denitrificans]|uniref:Tetratricopeptide repeat-containing protein n=1 Tax=Thiohalomonas denitrificans TaxID=415747 RepID=A0A1G5QS08_9GAMM|nr:tetratricopeptide repeat protein [Thiohalomonas denitrificans]SCZ64625.1 Tetratricopeptide repeat-containing protein [Thiohalomonas denitrificans]